MVLGHSLSLKGKKTLLIDADSQGSLSMILRLRPKHYLADFIIRRFDLELCVEVVSPTLHVLCSNRQTADAERHIGNELARERVLEDLLARYDSAYDAIVIDAGPSIGQMQTMRDGLCPAGADSLQHGLGFGFWRGSVHAVL